MEQSIPRQLQADLLLIPAAFPGSIPSTHFWVFQGLLSRCWVQLKVFMPVPKAWGALPPCNQQTPYFSSTPRAPPWISAVGSQELSFPRAETVSCCGHLPWNPTPLLWPSEPELGKPQAVLTRLFLFLQGSRPGISSLFSLS